MTGELCALAAAIEAGNDPLPPLIGKLIQNAPDSFDDGRAGQIAVTIRAMRRRGEPVSAVRLGEQHLDLATFIGTELEQASLPIDQAEYYAKECWEAFQIRKAKSILAEAHEAIIKSPDKWQTISERVHSALSAVTSESNSLIERISERIYSPQSKPIEPTARYSIAGTQICTPGNLTTISAQAKAGKSAVISAMTASTFARSDTDCLGFNSQNLNGFAVIKIDTEQSEFDHWEGNQRTMRRAQVDAAPPWLRSYCLTGFSADDVRASIPIILDESKKLYGGIHSVLIDGSADAAHDVNDPAETSSLINELHRLAIEFDCPILNVIHVNPGSDFKTRGHLGSQLERKSETNLRLEKDDSGMTVIWADKNRRAPIPKSTAPRFAWDDEAGMHVTVQSLKTAKDGVERDALVELARDMFANRPSMRHADLQTTVKNHLTVSDKTAERKVTRCRQLGIVKKTTAGLYILNA